MSLYFLLVSFNKATTIRSNDMQTSHLKILTHTKVLNLKGFTKDGTLTFWMLRSGGNKLPLNKKRNLLRRSVFFFPGNFYFLYFIQ